MVVKIIHHNVIIGYAYPYMNIIFPLDIADTSASAPAIELIAEMSHLPYSSPSTTKESSSASEATGNVCEITLRPEELKAQDSELCNICMANQIDCLILECGHMCTCLICAKELFYCPICRQEIARIVKAFRS